MVDDLSSGRLANLEEALERGAELHTEDVTDAAWMTDLAAIIRPERRLPPRRADRRPPVGRRPGVRRRRQHRGHGLGARRRPPCRREALVLASTAAVYGRPRELPTAETAAVAPLAPYGASKAAAESYLELYARVDGLSTLALRMSNVYGPRQDPARRVRRRGDLLRRRGGRHPGRRVRRRPPDAGLRVRGRRRRRVPGRRAERRLRRAEHRHRPRDSRSSRSPGASGWPSSTRRIDAARSSGRASTRRRRGGSLGWQARTPLSEGLARLRTPVPV